MPTIKVGRGDFRYDDLNVVCVPDSIQSQILDFVREWTGVVTPTPGTEAERQGVRSYFLRVAGMEDDGQFRVCGVDDRTRGLGLLSQISPQARYRLHAIRKSQPPLAWVDDSDYWSDDELWLGEAINHSCMLSKDDDRKLIIRCKVDPVRHPRVVAKSVVPLADAGCRLYLERLKLCSRVACRLGEDGQVVVGVLSGSAAIKPVSGAYTSTYGFILSDSDREKYEGRRGFGRILEKDDLDRLLIQHKSFYWQEFIPPMKTFYAPGLNVVHHYFLAFNCDKRLYELVGGMWMGNPGLMVVGHRESVSGPLTLQ